MASVARIGLAVGFAWLAVVGIVWAQSDEPIEPINVAAISPGMEPPQIIEVTIGDQKLALAEGVDASVTIDGKTLPIRVQRRESRTLRIAGMRVDYPAAWEFSYSEDAFSHEWVVENVETTLLIAVNKRAAAPQSVVELDASLAAGLSELGLTADGELPTIREVSRTLGGVTLKGRGTDVGDAVLRFSTEIYPLRLGKHGGTLTLIDAMEPSRRQSDSMRELMAMMQRSFALPTPTTQPASAEQAGG